MNERDRFEIWYCEDAARQGFDFVPQEIANLRDGDDYFSAYIMLNGKWQGWQARSKQENS